MTTHAEDPKTIAHDGEPRDGDPFLEAMSDLGASLLTVQVKAIALQRRFDRFVTDPEKLALLAPDTHAMIREAQDALSGAATMLAWAQGHDEGSAS